MPECLETVLGNAGIAPGAAQVGAQIAVVVFVVLVALVAVAIGRLVVGRVLKRLIGRHAAPWLRILYDRRVFHRMLPLIGWFVLGALLPPFPALSSLPLY